MNILLRWRRLIVALLHLSLVAASNYAAFLLRFDFTLPDAEWQHYLQALPSLLLIRGLLFYRFRLFQGLWRYTSLWDLRNIVLAVSISSVVFYFGIHWIVGMKAYPRSVMLIDPLLLVCLMAGVRLAHRMFPTLLPSLRAVAADAQRRVLVVGAGDAAEMIVREMRRHPEYGHEPVGFVEDDPQLQGQWIHGVPVLGGVRDLVRIMLETHPHEVLIAFTHEQPAAIRAVVRLLEPFKVPLTRLPQIEDLVNGRATVSHIRQLRVEDLLARAPIGLDADPVRRLIENHRIFVTGAGGSIGSELCRQIARWGPARLVLFERYENGLYTIESQLRDAYPDLEFVAAIGDVTDVDRLDAVIRAERPDIIFHAAAHKHVPLMEMNPCEAVKNNILGTQRVAEVAVRHNVGAFVLISTDKAVHPSSVMGATKRIAELIVQNLNGHHVTRFMTVRFGNVLGSSGSVLLRFLEQIEAGGPVTVTHPEIERYFMLIPEAVQLVLQAAAIGEAGGVYVLDMGEQIKLVEMARNLIRLAGHIPDEEIAIRFIGLRPGEKLSEQLVSDEELAEHSPVEKILRVQPRQPQAMSQQTLAAELAFLTAAASSGNGEDVLCLMQRIVPSFCPVGCHANAAALATAAASATAALGAATASAAALLPTAPRRPLVMAAGKSSKGRSDVSRGLGAAAILLCATSVLVDGCKSNPAPPTTTTPAPGGRTEYFVSPQGLPTNDGSIARPLDLATVLSKQSPVLPGQKIWLRGGTYQGGFISYVNGAENAPIVVRNYQGERAILDGSNTQAIEHGIVLQVLGTHVWFWGLELTFSNPSRIDTGNPSGPNGVYANESNDVKFINMVVHDVPGQGFGVWSESVNVEVYGNIIYYNGTNGFDHGIYAQNETNTKRIEDNVIFEQASHGLHAYGSTNAYLDHFLVSGNVSFNNGLLIGDPQRNLLIGGGRVAHDLTVTNNFTYFPPASNRGSNNIGYSAGCADATITGNAFVGPNALTLVNCMAMLTNNTFVGSVDPPDLEKRYGDNAYLPSLPTDDRVIVRANRYEPGRANIIVYNWDLETQVAVDLAQTGLRSGQGFEIRDAQDLFDAPVVTGTYTGAPVAVPLTGLHTATPVWNRAVPPRHTAPEFGVYVVFPR
jgi:FlaA1/EpsC-like NDP-sugar epimerase